MDDAFSLSDLVQANRLLRIETPLGEDVLLLERFAGREMVNGLFEFQAVVRAKRDDITPQDLVGKTVDWSLDLGQGGRESAQGRRVWNALVTDLQEEPRLKGGGRQYVLTLRPDLWLLSQKSDCRIWLNRTSLEVAETLMSEHGLARPDTGGVTQAPPAQGYSVQWNESDLDYLLRRLEEDGLFFWVRHQPGEQTVAIADGATAWDRGHDGGEGAVRYAEGSTDRDHITEWRRRFSFVPGKRAGRDWNFETPSTVPGGEAPSLVSLPRNGAYEFYEYPARALDASRNEAASKLRMQASEADHERIRGVSTVRTLAPGAKLRPFDVAHPEHAFETAVALLVEHEAAGTSYETAEGEPVYRNRVEALPARTPFTPHRHTRRPRIEGSQIALIAGPPGEEIHTDQYGRVKLWFPWDRRAKKDGSDTVWVRVGQPWAGGTWGAQTIPRIGMEAVVSFQDGDPDKPMVTALVPNPQQKVPYELPANKTKTVFRTNTHKSGGWQQSNELSFEDEMGREEVFIHAQRDATTKVRNHASERVDRNKVVSVGGAALTEVGQNRVDNIGHNMTINVGGGAVGPIVRYALAGDRYGVKQAAYFLGDMEALVTDSGNFGLNAAGSIAQTADHSLLLTATEDYHLSAGMNATVVVGENLSTAVTKESSEIVGTIKTIEAHETLRLRCGKAELVMHASGEVVLNGKTLDIEFDEHVSMKSKRIQLN